jgi:hypothetical protein
MTSSNLLKLRSRQTSRQVSVKLSVKSGKIILQTGKSKRD